MPFRTFLHQSIIVVMLLFVVTEGTKLYLDVNPVSNIEILDYSEKSSEQEEKKKEDYLSKSIQSFLFSEINNINNNLLLNTSSDVYLTVQTPPPNLV